MTDEIIPKDEMELLRGVHKDTVLELGNKKNKRGLYRTWYEHRGVDYTCLDWNGKDGALEMDMTYSITAEEIGGPFDWVTNFGFTEHVANQTMCWQNVHRFLKVGGRLVFVTPGPGHWELHGYHQPTLEWYRQFAELNGYTIEELFVNTDRVRPTINGRLLKTKDDLAILPKWSLMHRTRLKL